MKTTAELLSEAQALKAEGWSLQEIANKLGTSKSSVYRLLNDAGGDAKEEQLHSTVQPPSLNSNEYWQLEKLKLELAHKVRMEELSQARKKLEIEERAANIKLRQERDIQLAAQTQTFSDSDQQKQLQKRSKRLVTMFQAVLGTIQSEFEMGTLEETDWLHMLYKLASLQIKIQDHAASLGVADMETLAIWHYTSRLIAFTEEVLEKHNNRFFRSSLVDVYHDRDFCEEVIEMAVDDFLDEIEFEQED